MHRDISEINKLEEKKRRNSLVDNLNNKAVEEVKSKTKKKIDLDATCEYVFAFNQQKKKWGKDVFKEKT